MKWTEQDAKDAARLLERLEQRAKRETLAGGVRGPAQIAYPACPLLDKRADGENDQGVGTLNRRPQLTDSREELAGGSGKGGHAAMFRGTNGCARPGPDLTIGSTDRAKHALRGD